MPNRQVAHAQLMHCTCSGEHKEPTWLSTMMTVKQDNELLGYVLQLMLCSIIRTNTLVLCPFAASRQLAYPLWLPCSALPH